MTTTCRLPSAFRRRQAGLPLIAVALWSSFCFGALVKAAWADHYHTNCVGHGLVHGSSNNDGSFHSRVEHGCGTGAKRCAIYSGGSWQGDVTVGGSSTCNAWSQTFGSFTECASTARVSYSGVFGEHAHRAHNWCG